LPGKLSKQGSTHEIVQIFYSQVPSLPASRWPPPTGRRHSSRQEGCSRHQEALNGLLPYMLGQELYDDDAADGEEEYRPQGVHKEIKVLHTVLTSGLPCLRERTLPITEFWYCGGIRIQCWASHCLSSF